MSHITLNVLSKHGVPVHILRRNTPEELVTDSICSEESELSPTLHLEERFVFNDEVYFVDRLEIC